MSAVILPAMDSPTKRIGITRAYCSGCRSPLTAQDKKRCSKCRGRQNATPHSIGLRRKPGPQDRICKRMEKCCVCQDPLEPHEDFKCPTCKKRRCEQIVAEPNCALCSMCRKYERDRKRLSRAMDRAEPPKRYQAEVVLDPNRTILNFTPMPAFILQPPPPPPPGQTTSDIIGTLLPHLSKPQTDSACDREAGGQQTTNSAKAVEPIGNISFLPDLEDLDLGDDTTREEKIHRLLTHAYDATISPIILKLAHVTTIDSMLTYGEVSQGFISRMFQDFKVAASSCFIDLGSGVGNVVLQAHLETGCHAFGSELHSGRFAASIVFRTAVAILLSRHGLGDMRQLEQGVVFKEGDIFVEPHTIDLVPKADLILCNNRKFGADAVQRQVDSVLVPMKVGAVFVSLEKVVRGRGCRSTLKELGIVETKRMGEPGDVSWTNSATDYWVYEKPGPGPQKT
ncbi:histone methylation protein DOT1-domain-containing protein [Massariosphaeria phaeospora]|uniref:Histone-lysine N-methyltransferase, H3 lysine-79 specific n=1 Tax=Massariosphaeria phaeospora TaxID=100035 RepID=A0A7C8I4H6_9PLEO|nr:histone methylation protein DOT1-domain-containing protein [Massariosphaeria phaeospora]